MTDADSSTTPVEIQDRYREAGKMTGKARTRRATKPCQYEGCGDWAWARGFCGSHYQKMRNEGKLPAIRIVGDLNARFDASYEVNEATGCWEWTGWIHPNGYGILPVGGKNKKIRAHRFSYERFVGPIPDGMLVLHECDNRKCVCPRHIRVGTHKANSEDCISRGRHSGQTGANKPKITQDMAMTIRVLFARGLPLGRRNPHSMKKLADIYGVRQSTISDVLKGKLSAALMNRAKSARWPGPGRAAWIADRAARFRREPRVRAGPGQRTSALSGPSCVIELKHFLTPPSSKRLGARRQPDSET